MAREPKPIQSNGKSRPFSEGMVNRGGINTNPSSFLSRPAPPQPYKPASSGNTGSASKGQS
jgi:hypothetical protein